ncbi:MAG: hypothetical protein E6G10_23345 [Actinobacteria bacterium]|nr:MAG: hypothetical protein E6G10_23345 [Actinomycetota bacterium]
MRWPGREPRGCGVRAARRRGRRRARGAPPRWRRQPGAARRVDCARSRGRRWSATAPVAIAVAAPHRDAAFAAAREIADRIKAELPVRKREAEAKGADWVPGARPTAI